MRVYIWLPGEEAHGKIMEVVDHTPVVMIYKPRPLHLPLTNETMYDVSFETEALPIKPISVNGNILNLAFRRSSDPAVANGPTRAEAVAKWPELIPQLCQTFECPDCDQETYSLYFIETMQTACMTCHASFSDHYLQALTKANYQQNIKQTMDKIAGRIKYSHFYRERAVAEFEGVSGLDESLWNAEDDGGLL